MVTFYNGPHENCFSHFLLAPLAGTQMFLHHCTPHVSAHPMHAWRAQLTWTLRDRAFRSPTRGHEQQVARVTHSTRDTQARACIRPGPRAGLCAQQPGQTRACTESWSVPKFYCIVWQGSPVSSILQSVVPNRLGLWLLDQFSPWIAA